MIVQPDDAAVSCIYCQAVCRGDRCPNCGAPVRRAQSPAIADIGVALPPPEELRTMTRGQLWAWLLEQPLTKQQPGESYAEYTRRRSEIYSEGYHSWQAANWPL